jgi:hypothetical protein
MATTGRGQETSRAAKRGGRPVPAASSEHFELTWPYFMYTIMLCFLVSTIVLWLWSMLMPAPLEPLADPNKTPNPSKAPWYFVGLQELLVYFDPWIAGVVLPTLIIVGLMAIPYIDKNPRGIGEYNYTDRKFAVIMFSVGTAFWFILIIVGYFFRGPSWQWYWPWESWEIHKESHVVVHSWSTAGGLLFLVCYVVVGLGLPVALPYFLGPKAQEGSVLKKLCTGLQEFYEKRGLTIYVIEMLLLLGMIGIPIKMILRLFFNVKYILELPAINLNI